MLVLLSSENYLVIFRPNRCLHWCVETSESFVHICIHYYLEFLILCAEKCFYWFFFLKNTIITPIVFQSLSHVLLFATPWTAARQGSLSFTISWSLLQLMTIESMMLSNHLILCHSLLLLPFSWDKLFEISFHNHPSDLLHNRVGQECSSNLLSLAPLFVTCAPGIFS